MIGFTRLFIFEAIAAAVSYGLLLIYLRSLKREALEKAWDRGEAGGALERAPYVEAGMAEFEAGWLRRMLWLVVLVPYVLVGALIYFVN